MDRAYVPEKENRPCLGVPKEIHGPYFAGHVKGNQILCHIPWMKEEYLCNLKGSYDLDVHRSVTPGEAHGPCLGGQVGKEIPVHCHDPPRDKYKHAPAKLVEAQVPCPCGKMGANIQLHPNVPWKTKEYANLLEEIADFFNYILPRNSEMVARRYVVKKVKDIILRKWPETIVDVCGSTEFGLHLPTANVNIMYLGYKLTLHSIGDELRKANIAVENRLLIVDSGDRQLVTFTDKVTKLKVDITSYHLSGIYFFHLTGSASVFYPAFPILLLTIKQFIEYNGILGIDSYGLFLMLVHFFQATPVPPYKEDLGKLLI